MAQSIAARLTANVRQGFRRYDERVTAGDEDTPQTVYENPVAVLYSEAVQQKAYAGIVGVISSPVEVFEYEDCLLYTSPSPRDS